MDLQSFSEPDFDPKKWINRAWSSCGNQEKEAFVRNSVTRLQLYMKQLTNSLDETTTQIVTSVPRILQDASGLQVEGALLQQKLVSLEQKVQGVEEQTGQSIQSLQRIDQLKSRLENAASALREADKWAAQVTSLEAILENGVPTDTAKLTELNELVNAMTLSLEVLSEAPDYEKKRLQLEALYNRLEAAITPPLVEALTQMNAERASTYVGILYVSGRGAWARGCGRRAGAARVSAAWRLARAQHPRALHHMLAEQAATQVDWFANIIKSETPLAEVIRLYTDLLLSLEPSPNKIVSASLKLCSSPEEGITYLIDLKGDIDSFVTSIRGVLDSAAYCKEKVDTNALRQFGRAAYSPLRESLPTCTTLLTTELLRQLGDDKPQEDMIEQARSLLSQAEQSTSWLATAYNKARKIAGACASAYYTPAVEAFITEFLSRLTSLTRRIETEFVRSVADTKSSSRTTGVLSRMFPASLICENAVNVLLEVLADTNNWDSEKQEDAPHPLSDLASLLPGSPATAAPPTAGLRAARAQLAGLARTVLMQPLHAQLDKIPSLSVWNNNDSLSTDLPDFALSPQEYITEIGQYLMTLPQHLELHLSDKQAPLHLLNEVCNNTCDAYAEKILNIRNMDELGTKRCRTDIVYLSSVVEDLGSSVTHSLKNLEKSLRAATPAQNE